MSIPVLLAEKLLLGKKGMERESPAIAARYGEEAVRAAMDELEQSDRDILLQYPPTLIKAGIEKRLVADGATEKRKAPLAFPTGRTMRALRYAALSAAACLVLAFGVFMAGNPARSADGDIESQVASSGERSKGIGPGIVVYRKNGEKAVKLEQGAKVGEGDVIQISYIAGGETWGLIVSVDGNGTITRHYPDAGNSAALLEQAGEVPLGFSYQLDDAPFFERFIFISSRTSFNAQQVLDTIDKLSLAPDFTSRDLSEAVPSGLHVDDLVLVKRGE